MITTSLQFICERISKIRDDQYQDWLDINQVNKSNSMQIILTNFVIAVVRLPLTYFTFRNFSSRRVFNFYRYHAPNFWCKILNEFKPNFVVLTMFLKKYLCDLKLLFNTLIGKISLVIVLERFSFRLNSSTAKLWIILWWIRTELSFISRSLKGLL